MPPSRPREVIMPNSLWYLDYQNKTLLEIICQKGFLKKNEHERWEIYEDLAEKTIQWEPTPDKSKNSNPTSSKRGLHSIETSIATWLNLLALCED